VFTSEHVVQAPERRSGDPAQSMHVCWSYSNEKIILAEPSIKHRSVLTSTRAGRDSTGT